MNPAAQQLPDMTGQTLSAAIALLENYGFQFQASTKTHSTGEKVIL
ncbi:PASTA domain-containing protein [Phormidium nigroviride]